MPRENSNLFRQRPMPKRFPRFFDATILPLVSLTGYKLAEKVELARHMTNQLIRTGLTFRYVSDTRDWHQPGTKLRIQVWDALIKAGLARLHKLGSEMSGKVTRYKATDKLLDLKRQWRLRLLENIRLKRSTKMLNANHSTLLELIGDKFDPTTNKYVPKQTLSLRKQIELMTEYVDRTPERPYGRRDDRAIAAALEGYGWMEDEMERINEMNTSHAWQASVTDPESGKPHVFQPNVSLKMKIYVTDSGLRRGRLYGFGLLSGQHLRKAQRATIRIDGKRSVELDYSCMHLRLLYHRTGLCPNPAKDLYRPGRVFRKYYSLANASGENKRKLRQFVKRATNICLNNPNREEADRSIRNLLMNNKQEDAKFLRKVVFQVEGIKPQQLSEIAHRIVAAHPKLETFHFFDANVGSLLMEFDGKIMFHILRQFADANIPALGIHDGIVCRASDEQFTRNTMANVYRLYTGHEPVIR